MSCRHGDEGSADDDIEPSHISLPAPSVADGGSNDGTTPCGRSRCDVGRNENETVVEDDDGQVVVVDDGRGEANGGRTAECAPEAAATVPPAGDGKERNGSEAPPPPGGSVLLDSSGSDGADYATPGSGGGESPVGSDERSELELKPGSSALSAHATFVSGYDASFVSTRRSWQRLRPRHGRMPRQWLYDRCDGVSKYEEKPAKYCPMARKKRPPCRVCWPPVPLKWFPDLVEQNCWCEHVGKRGCVDPENRQARVGLLSTALACNVAGLLLLCVCAVSMTKERFDILWAVPFTHVWGHFVYPESEIDKQTLEYAVGLRAVAFKHLGTNHTETVISFSEFCDLPVSGSGVYARAFVAPAGRKRDGDCNACEETSKKIIPSLFLGMFSYLPTFITDINRMWATYDVNCQKFMASVFSWISLATSIYTWVNYNKNCFGYLNTEGTTYLNKDLQPVSPGSEDVFAVFVVTYHAGLGQVCLGLATFLKIIDIVCNIMVPTPTITRDHLEQVEYDWKYGPHSDDDDYIGDGVDGQMKGDEEDAVKPKATVLSNPDDEDHSTDIVIRRQLQGDPQDTAHLSDSCQTNA